MFEKLNYIELSGVKYPFKCDMLVLEQIQDKYGDLAEFENRFTGFAPAKNEDGECKRNEEGQIIGYYLEPDMTALGDLLFWMVEEGIDIEREELGTEAEVPERKKLIRSVDIAPRELVEVLREEFNRCFARKKGKSTQTKSKTTKEPEK